MSKEEKIKNFDPSGIGLSENQLFGLPFNFEESEIVILPVPWEVTASFGSGTSNAPGKILDASKQVDLYDFENPEAWKRGYFMMEQAEEIKNLNRSLAPKAREIIRMLEKGASLSADSNKTLAEINAASESMVAWVYNQCKTLMKRDKKVAVIGGDHSIPLGYYMALSEKHPGMGILQIDAHADLRNAYEGFKHSHASIMFNAAGLENISKIIQFGIRDLGQEEVEFANASDGKIELVNWYSVVQRVSDGETWSRICLELADLLPDKVCISIDVDGLDPSYCPTTGTPVPGGLTFDQSLVLLRSVKNSGKQIIGFDICETGNSDYDANVSSRLLYKMCNYL